MPGKKGKNSIKKSVEEDKSSKMDIEEEDNNDVESQSNNYNNEENNPKMRIYKIFNEIQSGSDLKENLKDLYEIYEEIKTSEFNDILTKIFAIIFKQYDKNVNPLKNIKDFIKKFLEKCVKNNKIKKKNIEFINYFCDLFTKNSKKSKIKLLCVYFLNSFLYPYSIGNVLLYKSNTLENIKLYILNILNGKQNILISVTLQLISKIPPLLNVDQIKQRLASLINGSNKAIKKEIIKVFENNEIDISIYLLKIYDDESTDMRLFAYEKLSKLKNFSDYRPFDKVRILFIGLCDSNEKIQENAKKILKNYLIYLGIIKTNKKNNEMEENNKMDIEGNELEINDKKNEEEEESSDNKNLSAKDKYKHAFSSKKKIINKKLSDSPSRIFDELDVEQFYNDSVYNYLYQIITQSILEFIEKDEIVEYCRNIIDNIKAYILENNNNLTKSNLSDKKRRLSINSQFSNVNNKNGLFNDIYFLQNLLFCLSNKKDDVSFFDDILDLLPDEKIYTEILNYFYKIEPNIFILHQLLIICSSYFSFLDPIGNKFFINFIQDFITDLKLSTYKISNFLTIKKKSLFSDKKDSESIDIQSIQKENSFCRNLDDIDEGKETTIIVENYLLPNNRKIIFSMEDLIEYTLIIYKKIFRNSANELFTEVMTIVSQLLESIEPPKKNNDSQNLYEGMSQGMSQKINNESSIDEPKTIREKQTELIQQNKDKSAEIEEIEEKIKLGNNKMNLQLNRDLKRKREEKAEIDKKIEELTFVEENTWFRINLLCKFIIINCKTLPAQQFNTMLQLIFIPSLKRGLFPRVTHSSLENVGLLSIIYYNTVFKNLHKLFFDNIINDETKEFLPNTRISLSILLDSSLVNNLQELQNGVIQGNVIDILDMIIDKYLYNDNYDARILIFTGITKMLLANRVNPHENLISRLFVCLFKSYQIIDKKSEIYHIKISEIMNNFMFFYSLQGKEHLNSVIKAIDIILTSQLCFISDHSFKKNLLSHYYETKYYFLNNFLYLVFQNASKKLKNQNYSNIVFKIFKYIFYVFKYIKEEEASSIPPTKNNDSDINTNTNNINNNNVNNNDEKKYIKSINISNDLIVTVSDSIQNFFNKNEIDQILYNYFMTNDDFGKFYAIMFVLDENNILPFFSKFLFDKMKEFRDNGYKTEINGTVKDYSIEENKLKLRKRIKDKENKYYKFFEDYFIYCTNIRGIMINELSDFNKIEEESNEDNDQEMSINDDNKTDKKKDINNKPPLNESISNEEPDVRENSKDKSNSSDNQNSSEKKNDNEEYSAKVSKGKIKQPQKKKSNIRERKRKNK